MEIATPIVVLSDLHLGHPASRITQVAQLAPLLDGAKTAIFNGDSAEVRSFALLERAEALLEELRGLCYQLGVTPLFINGNHDPYLSELNYLDLCKGKVFVTHGDLFYPHISPWSRECTPQAREQMDAILGELDSEDWGDLDRRLQAVKECCMVLEAKETEGFHPLISKLRTILQATWPPYRLWEVLQTWKRGGRAALPYLEKYRPNAQFTLFGHIHRPSIFQANSRTVINTGSYLTMGQATLVHLEDDSLTITAVRAANPSFVPGKTLARFPLSPQQ